MANELEVTITTRFVPEVQARLRRAGVNAVDDLGVALEEWAGRVMAKSQPLVPIESGELRDSAIIEPHVNIGNLTGVVAGYARNGGAQQYAIRQHEDLTLNHPNGGQAKFLEQPFLEEIPNSMTIIANRFFTLLKARSA